MLSLNEVPLLIVIVIVIILNYTRFRALPMDE